MCTTSVVADELTPFTTPTKDIMGHVAKPAQFLPVDGLVSDTNPPDFSWPYVDGADFILKITGSTGLAEEIPVSSVNWFNMHSLKPGKYIWQVRNLNSSTPALWSKLRSFSINSDAEYFVVPSAGEILATVTATPRPRTFPRGKDLATLQGLVLGARHSDWQTLLARVDGGILLHVPAEPVVGTDFDTIWEMASNELLLVREAAFAYLISGKKIYLQEAKRRVLNLSSWDPGGITGFSKERITASKIMLSIALGYDWLYSSFTPLELTHLRAALEERASDFYNFYFAADFLFKDPADSHGWRNTPFTIVAAIALVGDSPFAAGWVKGMMPWYFHSICPWGPEDGGFANGTAYNMWDVYSVMPLWDMMYWGAGVNVYRKSWVFNQIDFMTYFLPPGTPTGAFGDGAEGNAIDYRSLVAVMFDARISTKLSSWYVNNTPGADNSRFGVLSALPMHNIFSRYTAIPPDIPNGKVFSSVGFVAMHEDLSSRDSVSVNFKSGFYGGFGHGHLDQNSFIVNVGDDPLAIDSGYYDGFNTVHWQQWYKQTRAHNAITFDGGIGQQPYTDMSAKGRVVSFSHSQFEDIVVGDAVQAYNGLLTKATRTLRYTRPNIIMVRDELASHFERKWEWNIHSYNKMKVINDQKVQISYNEHTLCVEIISPVDISFSQTDVFTAKNNNGKPDQWHGKFMVNNSSKKEEFHVIMTVDGACL